MSYEIVGNKITSIVEVDLEYIQDWCMEATEKDITTEEAAAYLKQMPSSIIHGIMQWGENDSEVRNEIFGWFEKNK